LTASHYQKKIDIAFMLSYHIEIAPSSP